MGNEWAQEVQTNCPSATVPLFWEEADTSSRNADPHSVHANHSANLASISLCLLPAFASCLLSYMRHRFLLRGRTAGRLSSGFPQGVSIAGRDGAPGEILRVRAAAAFGQTEPKRVIGKNFFQGRG